MENINFDVHNSVQNQSLSRKGLDELEKLLSKEIELQNSFFAISSKKTEALVKLDFDGVQKLVREEQQVLSALAMIINSRVNILSKIAKESNRDDLTVSGFAKTLQEPDRSRILDLSSQLRSIMISVNRVVQRNKALIETFMSTTSDFFKTICTAVTEDISYSRVGSSLKQSAPRLLIDQIV